MKENIKSPGQTYMLDSASPTPPILKGLSMRPFLEPGERLLVLPVEAVDVKRYQIIAFYKGASSNLTAHRVLRITHQDGKPVFITRGDNPQSYFSSVRASQIQGRVAGKIKNGSPVYFKRMHECLGYIRSHLYWQFKINAKWLIRVGFNFIYPFLHKKYVLFENNDELFVIKGIALGRSIGECRVVAGTAEYYCNNHLFSLWRRSLQSRLHRMALRMGLVCKNSIL